MKTVDSTIIEKMKTTNIVLDDLEKTYITFRGRVTALKKIDLKIEPGEFFVLLGPSGCGKSTLLNLIAGLEKPTRGIMSFGDKIVAEPAKNHFLGPFDRDIAMVFQSYALYPHMTIEENLAFPLTNMKQNRPSKEEMKKIAGNAAKILKIENLLNRKPGELSGGQRQRVAIGRAIVRNPQIFLMDEPLSNLDAQLRTEMRAQLKALQQDLGVTSVYVTHDQLEAMTLGDRIAIVNDGYIQQLGTPVDVYEKPINTFIARFIGNPPMNLIYGKFVETEGKPMLQSKDFLVKLPDEIASKLKSFSKDSYAIGIRPEKIKAVEKGQGNVDVPIAVIENIGAEFLINIFMEEGDFIVKCNDLPSGAAAGETIGLNLDGRFMHIFGPDGNRMD